MKVNRAEKTDNSDDSKLLVSVYISPKTLEKIDDLLFSLKKRMPIQKRGKLSKSVFYELCLSILIEDYQIDPEESPLSKAVHRLMQD